MKKVSNEIKVIRLEKQINHAKDCGCCCELIPYMKQQAKELKVEIIKEIGGVDYILEGNDLIERLDILQEKKTR